MKALLAWLMLLMCGTASATCLTVNGAQFTANGSPLCLDGSSSPLNLPLVQSTSGTFTFLGSFKVPVGGGSTFSYGGEAMSVNGTTMYLAGDYYTLGSVQIPTLSGTPAYDGSNGLATVITNATCIGTPSGPCVGPPTQSALTTLTTGGSLPASTAYYVYVTAANGAGQTNVSNEETITTGSTTATNSLGVSWTAQSNSTGYYVWIGTSSKGENNYFYVAGGSSTSYTVTTATGTSGTLPVVNETSLNCGQAASVTHCALQGSLVYNGNLYISAAPFYDTAGGANGFLAEANTSLTSFGLINSASTSCLTAGLCTYRYFAGALGVVPSIWQPYLGGPCYEVNGPFLAVASAAINGFGFSTFNCGSYNPSGAAVPVTDGLDYYYGGVSRRPNQYALSYRNLTGSLPLAGGNGCAVTLATAPVNGNTTATLSAGFAGCNTTAPDNPYIITFSDGETRLVHLTNTSTAVPDGLYTCYFGVTGCASFPALTNCPTGGCTTSATVNPVGDNYLSEYDGPLGYGFIVPGSRSLLFISVHQYGPAETRGTGCDTGASGSNDTPISPDTLHYSRLQVTAYDLKDIYNAMQGSQTVYATNPYSYWEFPDWQQVANTTTNCPEMKGNGSFFFDPTTDILYGTLSSNTYGSGNMIVDEWKVNTLP